MTRQVVVVHLAGAAAGAAAVILVIASGVEAGLEEAGLDQRCQ